MVLFQDLLANFLEQFRIVFQQLDDPLAALAQAKFAIGEPGAALLDKAVQHTQVEDVTLDRNPLVEDDIELDLAEGGCDLVLDDRHLGLVADDLVTLLDLSDASDVEPDRGIELERPPAGRRLGVAEHDADLLANLVDEDDAGSRLADDAGELAQCLAHEPCLETDEVVAHLPLELGARHERCH